MRVLGHLSDLNRFGFLRRLDYIIHVRAILLHIALAPWQSSELTGVVHDVLFLIRMGTFLFLFLSLYCLWYLL